MFTAATTAMLEGSFLDLILAPLAFLAVGCIGYVILLVIDWFIRRKHQRQREAHIRAELKRMRKRFRRTMSRTHPSMKPWVNQSTGRLHATVR